MDSVPAPVQILCKQCSAPLPVEQGSKFVNCEFCGTTNVVEKGRTVFHYAVRATVNDEAAEKALRRWMAGNQTIKGLDREAQIKEPHFEYFPMWLVRTENEGRENIYLEPAAALSVSELKHIVIPAGDLEHYDQEVDNSAVKATVPYSAMAGWLKDEHKIKETEIKELSLVHLPIYIFKYVYNDQSYTAVVDGASGEVFANIYPSKWEVPYVTLGAIAFVVYFCAALIPVSSYLIGDSSGLGLGVLIYAVAVIVVTIPFFIAAMTISAKV
jgi:LSD1 subclass zinc finger protein